MRWGRGGASSRRPPPPRPRSRGGGGGAVVSTPYAYAAELLGEGRGVLVPPGSPSRLASALNQVLGDDRLRGAIGRRAYDHTRRMVWSRVGADYGRLFRRTGAGIGGGVRVATGDG